jgi:AcrR family transcriptional regulator
MASADTRQSLLAAATAAFAEKGFSGARVDEIAARARANKAMIYYHFRTKQGLFEAVVVALLAEARTAMEEIAAAVADPARRLPRLYDGLAALFARRPALPRIVLHELLSGGAHLKPAAARAMGAVFAVILAAMQEGMRAGTFRPVNALHVHLNVMGTLLIDAVGAPLRDRIRAANPEIHLPAEDPGALRDYLHDVLARTLGAKGARRHRS